MQHTIGTHIPSICDIEVPYLCAGPYDHDGDWLDYPEQQHVTLEHMRSHQFNKYDPTHLASVLQNWLFFGLLRAILPTELVVRDADFVHTDETGARTVKSSLVLDLLQEWHALEAQLPADQKRARFQANAKILSVARPLVYHLSSFPETNVGINLFPAIPRNVALSCAELGEHLRLATVAILDPGDEFDGMDRMGWGNSAYFLERMEAQGWCPFIIAELDRVSSFLLTQYLATIGPPLIRRNHRSCSDHKCTFVRTGVEHTSKACPCSLQEIDISELRGLIEKKRTPVIRLIHGTTGPRIFVKKARKSMRYVAISHVWADGLGNPESNSMPLCQLERIQKLVNRLYKLKCEGDEGNGDERHLSSGWFWIDTLCVPNGRRYPDLCKVALPRMKDIYVEADKVLVLDSEMAACEDTDPQRMLARLWLSSWTRRLWTLQEGYFAKELLFLVGDSIVSIVDLIRDATDSGLPPPLDRIASGRWDGVEGHYRGLFRRSCVLPVSENSLIGPPANRGTIMRTLLGIISFILPRVAWDGVRVASDFLSGLFYGARDLGDQQYQWEANEGLVATVLGAVSSRVSTMATDEAGCLGLLLNVDTRSIYEIPVIERSEETMVSSATQRMIELFKLLDARGAKLKPPGCIPPGTLLLPGPRMAVDGYRWAPRSFMLGSSRPRSMQLHEFTVSSEFPNLEPMLRQSGVLSEYGLQVQFPGFRLGKVRADGPMKSYFAVDTSNGVAAGPWSGPLPAWAMTYSRDDSDPTWEKMAPSPQSRAMAIILFSYGPWHLVSEGILVRVRQELEDGSLAVSRVCRMLVSGVPEYDGQDWMKEPWARVNGEWLPPRQIWCVD